MIPSWRVRLLQIVLGTGWKVICHNLLQHAKYHSILRDLLYRLHVRFEQSDRIGCYMFRRDTHIGPFVYWNLLQKYIKDIA